MDKVMITGASDGIGRCMAEAFAKRGAKLGLIARREEMLVSLAAKLRTLGSPQVEWVACDVTDSPSFRKGLEKLDDQLGGATHFIANAGIGGAAKRHLDSYPIIHQCLLVNVLAAIEGLELMKERMIKRGSGVLVGVSSVAATRGLPDSAGYSTSKAAITNYLESLRVDLRGSGVKVLTIAPGFIDTALTKKNSGKMPFLMTVDRAAEVFVRGVLKHQRFIVAPWQYGWVIPLMRFLPIPLYDWMVGRAFGYVRGKKRV